MENAPKINVSYENIFIKDISFKRAEKLEFKPYNIQFQDVISVVEFDENGFKIEYERNSLTSDPFSFAVKFDFYCRFDAKSKEVMNGDLNKIKEFAEKQKEFITNSLNLPSRASLIIGEITSNLGTPYLSRPFITK